MTKIFTRYIVNTFILITFSLSQITNVNANSLKECPQKEKISFSAMKQEQKEVINTAALYASNFIYGANSKDGIEGKVVKVFKPITLGIFSSTGAISFGMLTGITMGLFPGIIGWFLGKLELRNKMALRDS